MTKIEKIVYSVIGVLIVTFIGSCVATIHNVEKAGGIKQIIIEVGKEVKDIRREIGKAAD